MTDREAARINAAYAGKLSGDLAVLREAASELSKAATEAHGTVLGIDVERHDGPEPVCVGQWCCGCNEHPIGKPWGWNWLAWERHYIECHGGHAPRA